MIRVHLAAKAAACPCRVWPVFRLIRLTDPHPQQSCWPPTGRYFSIHASQPTRDGERGMDFETSSG